MSTQENVVPQAPAPILLTERASLMVKQAMEQEGLTDGYALRVGVVGGGCSGLQYLLDFSKEFTDLDFQFEQFNLKILIDPFSAAHLYNPAMQNPTVIDYVDDLQGSGFKFENSNVVRSCGCGSSFQT